MISHNEEGKPIRKQFYGKTQKEVKDKLEDYKKELLLNTYNVDYDNIVNVNIKMYKKWKIKMYNLGSTIHQLSYHQ